MTGRRAGFSSQQVRYATQYAGATNDRSVVIVRPFHLVTAGAEVPHVVAEVYSAAAADGFGVIYSAVVCHRCSHR